MYVYLRTELQVSSIILTSSRRRGRGGNFTHPPQNEPLKSPPRLGLINISKSWSVTQITSLKWHLVILSSAFEKWR